jgi:FlaA1/EpsC-like NDP-sugar epimerase
LWRGAPPHPQEVTSQKQNKFKQRALIFGAGDAGTMIVREIRANPTVELEPIAFLDDDASKKGSYIHNLPVLGDRHALAEVVQAQHIDTVIIAMPKAPGRVIRDITQLCHQIGVPVKTVPGLYEILGGSVKVSAIREVELDDLLRREPVTIDLPQIGQYLGGARVLVTGAGGSIGSELCRQIAPFAPERLILFELSENNLYQIIANWLHTFQHCLSPPLLAMCGTRKKWGPSWRNSSPRSSSTPRRTSTCR